MHVKKFDFILIFRKKYSHHNFIPKNHTQYLNNLGVPPLHKGANQLLRLYAPLHNGVGLSALLW
ncbi:hypothetical protein FEM08_35780 [Flavobacterium gilvum]|nr:hypothetical protein FEM08_35780 [Flavobacterium gilvum]